MQFSGRLCSDELALVSIATTNGSDANDENGDDGKGDKDPVKRYATSEDVCSFWHNQEVHTLRSKQSPTWR